jgi:hypothetical protein
VKKTDITTFWVLVKNSQKEVIKGTEKEISVWLSEAGDVSGYDVYDNRSHVYRKANFFLQTHHAEEKAAEQARNAKILQLVISAMSKQAKATYDGDVDGMDVVALETSKEIVKLFEGE